MKTEFLTSIAIALIAMNLNGQTDVFQSDKLMKLWEVTGLEVPESVLPIQDKQVLYVSNIGTIDTTTEKDGNGFISLLSYSGEIINLKWTTGLNAPKGMAIVGDKLFVTDIDRIAEININTGEAIKYYPVAGAKFLNDIVASKEGWLYISDSKTKKVYKLANGEITDLVQSDEFGKPNGITIVNDKILLGTGDKVVKIDPVTAQIEDCLINTGGVDGLANIGPGVFIFSDWSGRVYQMKKGEEKELILDTSGTEKIKAADFGFDPEIRRIYVPTFFGNSVVCYQLK